MVYTTVEECNSQVTSFVAHKFKDSTVNVKRLFLILLLLMAACRNNPTETVPDSPTLSSTEIPLVVPTNAFVEGDGNIGEQASETPTAEVTQETLEPTAVPTEERVEPMSGILPAPVYYIDGVTRQVMRLERDGLTTTVITDEPSGVEAFSISAETLVYDSNNDLIVLNLATGNRRVLLTGDKMSDDVLTGEATFSPINAPSISPDGTQVAFALNGIQTISLEGDMPPVLRLANDPTPDFSDPNVEIPDAPIRQFFGAQWSPDGTQLAVEFAYFPEGGGVGVIDILDGNFTDLSMLAHESDAIACCEFMWIAPGQALLASDLVIYGTPGVAQVDTLSKTVTPLITSVGDNDELPTLFRAPTQNDAGDRLVFSGELRALDEPASYFQIAQLNADGSTTIVHDELFTLDQSVLWTPGGDGVLVGEGQTVFPSGANGGMRWVQLDGDAITLPVDGYQFAWGAEMQMLAQSDVEGLRERVSADFSLSPEAEFATQRILGRGKTLYIAYTVGGRSYDPPTDHQLGIYEYANENWELLSLTPLGDDGMDEASPLGYGPDYLGEGAITQVFIEPTNIWLLASGGVGAHSGVVKLFRFDGTQLQPVANNFNGSPFAGWAEDLNGDGLQEFILDHTEPYVFCYACGVRRVDFEVLRWNGTELERTMLTQVEGDALNNRAVELAQAGLWIDAGATAYQLRDSENETVQWNAYLIDLTSRYRTLMVESPYPIMSYMFNGDYLGATFPFDGLAPEAIFDINGELFAGTVADGWTDTMFPEIIETTTRAISAKPEEAGAYFLRGWAKFFMNEGTVLEDIAKAAELAPMNPTFTAAHDYLTP